ncbi:MAG: helix-turn-helix domain-containing protein, partial [Blastocatellia bacterium]|nr:helix-turn-helix domain-containing protein [Blastocatellia bacterium]
MRSYSGAAWERAMKREEIILRAYAKKISWIEAAEILGMSCRHLRRVRDKYEEWGFDGLHDGRVGKASPRRVPVAVVEEVLRLYRDEYFDFNAPYNATGRNSVHADSENRSRARVLDPDRADR